MIVPLEPHGPGHRPDCSARVFGEDVSSTDEVGVPTELTSLAIKRVAVPDGVLTNSAPRASLARPRFGDFPNVDSVLLADTREPVGEPVVRPKRVRLLIYFDTPVIRDDIREVTYEDGRHAFGVESLDERANESILSVVALAGAFAIQPLDPPAGATAFRKFPSEGCDMLCDGSILIKERSSLEEIL